MAESLKDVIAKLKAQQNSPTSKPEKEMESEAVDDIEEDEEEFEEEDTPTPKVPEKPKEAPKPNPDAELKKIQEAISSLHDNGVYRLETLNNLQEINKSLKVIAGVLLELSGYGNKSK